MSMNVCKPNLKAALSESLFERIPFDPEKSELTGYSNYSYWQSTFRTFFKNVPRCCCSPSCVHLC